MEGSGELRVAVPPALITVPLCSSGLRPQEKSSVWDWAIVLITLTVVATMVSLLNGTKKVSETVAQTWGSQGQWGWDLTF